jgi:hypothetical protein
VEHTYLCSNTRLDMGWSYFLKFNDVILFLRDDALDDNEVLVVTIFQS